MCSAGSRSQFGSLSHCPHHQLISPPHMLESRSSYFTWARLLSLAGNMLAQTPQSAAGVPHRPYHSLSTPRCVRNQGRCRVIPGEGWAVAQGWFTDSRVYDLQA